jgi:hypothetical protein
MQTIGSQRLWSYTHHGELAERRSPEIRRDQACRVQNFMELATKIAALQFKNPDFVLLFRGQSRDYMRRKSSGTQYTSLAPSLFGYLLVAMNCVIVSNYLNNRT